MIRLILIRKAVFGTANNQIKINVISCLHYDSVGTETRLLPDDSV